MANGGKDVRLGDDKRPVSIIPKNEDFLYNIANGELLTDEFGTPLITNVDQFFTLDNTARRSTSIVFPKDPSDVFYDTNTDKLITSYSAQYGANLDVGITTNSVKLVNGSLVAFASTVGLGTQPHINAVGLSTYFQQFEVRTVTDQGGSEKNRVYFPPNTGIGTIIGAIYGDNVKGLGVPDGTIVLRAEDDRLFLSKNTTGGLRSDGLEIYKSRRRLKTSNNVWKIEEQFKETSEVSNTLLGVNRAETQLSLFSNVSSYGLNVDDFEFFVYNGGNSFGSWDTRINKTYGRRYNAGRREEVQESAIRLDSFSVPFSFPFGPKFARLGIYNQELYEQYRTFIRMGRALYEFFDTGNGSTLGYPADWKDKFLNPETVTDDGNEVIYSAGIQASFSAIDTWTETWRDITFSNLADPVVPGGLFNFPRINALDILGNGSTFDQGSQRGGYSDRDIRFSYLQSRRVFRYQPGRISGYTFGLRSSVAPRDGAILEWGIKNPTDHYVFRIRKGQLSIIRRSTIPLDADALKRSGLTLTDQVEQTSGDPLDSETYWTIDIPRDNFNGDPLNGNGPSGWNIQPDKVTMWKIEFGWYGAIGARFYAYIPAGNGEARWVVIHTIVIENSMGSPCLQDSYFRLTYSLNIFNNNLIRTPQFLYKYGASYYIDGGDEGTSQIFSVSSGDKTINTSNQETLIGVTPKEFMVNSVGQEIKNKKLIIPTRLNLTSDSLAEMKIVTCKACPGFGHVYTPGIGCTVSGRETNIRFLDDGKTILADDEINNPFTKADIGSKIIAPSIWNAYITDVGNPIIGTDSFREATIRGWGPGYNGYPNYHTAAQRSFINAEVFDQVAGIVTTIVGAATTYPHTIRLSNPDNHYVASPFKFTGSKIEIQFLNPAQNDSYSHFADFVIGITDKAPRDTGGSEPVSNTFDGFQLPGVGAGLTTILPNADSLYAESTHTYAFMDENGVEKAEAWSPLTPRRRMGLDYRIGNPPGDASGICSKVVVEVDDPQQIQGLEQVGYLPTDPSKTVITTPNARFFLDKAGTFPVGVAFTGGQVKLSLEQNPSGAEYVGEPVTYTVGNDVRSYIEVNQGVGSTTTPFSVDIRPVKITASQNPTRQKLFNYNPFPLYFYAKFGDNAAINNLSIKETVGDFTRTISPKLLTLSSNNNIAITNANGQADTSGAPPTNFDEVDRLSSASVDVQNEQRLRPGTSVDTIFIGKDETLELDMEKVFGVDRNVITPDNQNTEATFLVAKKLNTDGGSNGTIRASLNYKEQ